MKIEYFEIKCDKNGNTKPNGAVAVNGAIIKSARKGGCGLEGCNCSPGRYITIVLPRQRGKIIGLKCMFKNDAEYYKFMDTGTIYGVEKHDDEDVHY